MPIWDGIVKAIIGSSAAGFTADYLLTNYLLRLSPLRDHPSYHSACRVSFTGLCSMCGFLFAARGWIQGYYFDRMYKKNKNLRGKNVVITGCTIGGIGFAAAEIFFVELGANVIITCRTKSKGDAAVQALLAKKKKMMKKKECVAEGTVSCVLIDFLSESSIRAGAKEIRSRWEEIHFLVLNAGIGMGNSYDVWMTNHVGPFIFTEELRSRILKAACQNESSHSSSSLPPEKQQAYCRVVSVSSGAHKRSQIHWEDPWNPPSFAYGQSKLANIMHMRELQKQLSPKGYPDVRCFAVTPGAVTTNIFPQISSLKPIFWALFRSPLIGAQVIKMACLDDNLNGGEYLSNCYVKPAEGLNSCSNDEAQWHKLWQLTESHIKDKRHLKIDESK